MADTDLPNGYGTIEPAPRRRVRPIASPFGMLPTDGLTPPQPGAPPPGFNVTAPTAAETPSLGSSLAAMMPSREDLAGALGAPVDGLAWGLRNWMGLPIPSDMSYGGSGLGNTSIRGQPTWAPGPNVPLSSQNILGMMNNAPSWDAMLRAMRRPGLF
jgi:hypothetical protein